MKVFRSQERGLLSLPKEVLQEFARQFTLAEWIRGPARTCRLLHRMELLWVDLICYKREWGIHNGALDAASNQMSRALACAGRRTGPCTTSIRLSTQSVRHSLINLQDQPKALTGPSVLANVVYLELKLHSFDKEDDAGIRQLVGKILQRLPNLVAASFMLTGRRNVFALTPILRLRHLDMSYLQNLEALDHMPFGAVLPALETARISTFHTRQISELDFSGCQHLTRLVLIDAVAPRLSKPPQCRLRVELKDWWPTYIDRPELQPDLSQADEVFFTCSGTYSPQRLVAQACLPKLEVIRCDAYNESNDLSIPMYDNDGLDRGKERHPFVTYLKHSGNLPALKSILCGDEYDATEAVMKANIPEDLAGVKELMIASKRPLQLVFGNACNAGQRLQTFFAVAREVRMDMAALSSMQCALSGRGLTLSMAHAEHWHEHAPSQCLYIHAASAPQLSYDDAIRRVNARLQAWGRNFETCGQCGACFQCLRVAGSLDGMLTEDVIP